jgi:hypothetical protein
VDFARDPGEVVLRPSGPVFDAHQNVFSGFWSRQGDKSFRRPSQQGWRRSRFAPPVYPLHRRSATHARLSARTGRHDRMVCPAARHRGVDKTEFPRKISLALFEKVNL